MCPLIFRTIQGTISNSINYSVNKFIPASIIAVVNQLSPIATVVLAFFILKEVIKAFDCGIMAINLAAILLTIIFEKPGNSDLATPNISMWIIYALLVINPFLSSAGTIAMRKMKKFSEYVVSWYLNWGIFLSSMGLLAATQTNNMFLTFEYFTWYSWVVGIASGVLGTLQNVFRFKALKYQKASVL